MMTKMAKEAIGYLKIESKIGEVEDVKKRRGEARTGSEGFRIQVENLASRLEGLLGCGLLKLVEGHFIFLQSNLDEVSNPP